jgi:hypothetical protein
MTGISISKLSVTKAGLYQKIRSGLFLSLKVGRTLLSGEQEVKINGKPLLLPKSTGLIQGKSYNVQYTVKKDGSLLLHIPKDEPSPSQRPVLHEGERRIFPGADRRVLDRQVLDILGKSGILPSGLLVDTLTALVKEKKPGPLGKALLSILLGKKILPNREIYEELLPLFSGDREDSSSEGGYGGRSSDGKNKKESGSSELSPDSLKSAIALETEQPRLLHLFNALAAEDGQWIIIPLPDREQNGDILKGVIRMLIDPADGGRVKRMVLSLFSDEHEGFHFLFRYLPGSQKPLLSLYLPEYGREGLEGSEGAEFLKKIDNLGFKIDDIQREDSFTGYDSDHTIPEGIDLEA